MSNSVWYWKSLPIYGAVCKKLIRVEYGKVYLTIMPSIWWVAGLTFIACLECVLVWMRLVEIGVPQEDLRKYNTNFVCFVTDMDLNQIMLSWQKTSIYQCKYLCLTLSGEMPS